MTALHVLCMTLKPAYLYCNCTQLSRTHASCKIMLINAFTHFEVHTSATEKVCVQISFKPFLPVVRRLHLTFTMQAFRYLQWVMTVLILSVYVCGSMYVHCSIALTSIIAVVIVCMQKPIGFSHRSAVLTTQL